MGTTIYLLRHGATAVNRMRPYRLQGCGSDLPLEPVGLEQSRRAGEALAGCGLAAVYTSPLTRARETAVAVGRPHGLVPIEVRGLIEADLGGWEGLTWEEARGRDPELYESFHAHPGTVPYPGGESFADAGRRAGLELEELAARHEGERIAVVSHHVVNRAVLAPMLGLPMDLARSIRQANCGINVVVYEGGRAVVETLNSALHLDGVV